MENQSFDFSTTTELSDVDDPEPPSPNIESLGHKAQNKEIIESLSLDAMQIREMAARIFEMSKPGNDKDERKLLREQMRQYQSHLLGYEAFIRSNIGSLDPADAEVVTDEIWLAKRCK